MKAYKAAILLAVLNLGACSFGTESLWPALTGEDSPVIEAEPTTLESEVKMVAEQQTSQDYVSVAPDIITENGDLEDASEPLLSLQNETDDTLSLGTTNFIMPSVTPGQPTGTYVGQQIEQLRAELVRLQGVVTQRNEVLQSLRNRAINTAKHEYHKDRIRQ